MPVKITHRMVKCRECKNGIVGKKPCFWCEGTCEIPEMIKVYVEDDIEQMSLVC